MTYTIFGCSNPTGAYFLEYISGCSVEVWGRKEPVDESFKFVYCDLTLPPQSSLGNIKGVLISFAPIWLLAEFLAKASVEKPSILRDLTGIVAVSSSSYLTKRFAFSSYDKGLSESLRNAHSLLADVSNSLNVVCHILAPSLVYGTKNGYSDRNIRTIIRLTRIMPFIVLPKQTGSRQPIHASQLAQVVLFKAQSISYPWDRIQPEILTLGGDETISYSQMISRVKNALPIKDKGRGCRIIEVPNRVFFTFVAGILPLDTKLFEAIMRITSDLSGFSTPSKILGEKPSIFPILPLPI
jgi:hypothetical protein